MKTFMGSDHRGIRLKGLISHVFAAKGWDITDLGPYEETPGVDYPDFALRVCDAVTGDTDAKGILICGTGVGMSIAANKFNGIRAALCCNVEVAAMTRRHNDANVLVLSADYTDEATLEQLLEAFFTTEFEGGRHARRLEKIKDSERRDS